MMNVTFRALPAVKPVVFGQSSPAPLFKTDMFTVNVDTEKPEEANHLRLGNLVDFIKTTFALLDANRGDKAGKASEKAAGYDIALGGKEEITHEKLQEKKMGWLSARIESVKEGLKIFWEKLKILFHKPNEKGKVRRFANLQQILDDLFSGSSSSEAKKEDSKPAADGAPSAAADKAA